MVELEAEMYGWLRMRLQQARLSRPSQHTGCNTVRVRKEDYEHEHSEWGKARYWCKRSS
jgi:hypothetical protein